MDFSLDHNIYLQGLLYLIYCDLVCGGLPMIKCRQNLDIRYNLRFIKLVVIKQNNNILTFNTKLVFWDLKKREMGPKIGWNQEIHHPD
jgi:hypothetical protein